MTDKTCNVAFLSSGNSAPSIFGEACLQAMRYPTRFGVKKRLCLAASALALAPTAAMASPPTLQDIIGDPEWLTLSGSSRMRYETLEGQPRAGLNATDEQLALRTIITAQVDLQAIKVNAEVHDSRAWLTKPGGAVSANEVNAFELVQANIAGDVTLNGGAKLSLQLGRMTLGLGSRRLVAADDYRNATNGYTGLRADLRTKGGLAATAIYVLPHIRLPDDLPSIKAQQPKWDRESFDLQLWGGLVSHTGFVRHLTLEAGYFGLLERDWPGRVTRQRNLDSFSARLIRDPRPGKVDFELEGIYQSGTVRASASTSAAILSVSAWFVHADAGYSFPGAAKVRLSLEYDRASGDEPSGKFGRFDTLFGMRGADLALSGIYNAIGRANISAVGVRLEKGLAGRWEGFITYKPMWLASQTDSFSTTGVRDLTGSAGNFAGHQVELQLRYWLVPKFLRAQLNAANLSKGRFLRTAPNAVTNADTRYVATTISVHF